MNNPWNNKTAMALIMVVVVISALLIIATPFAISMRLEEKASNSYAGEAEARLLSRGAFNHMVASLYETHEDTERKKTLQKKQQGGGAGPASAQEDPRYDSPEELEVKWPAKFGQDVVILTDGTTLKGEIVKEDTYRVIFRTKEGEQNLSKSDVQSMIRARFSTGNPMGKMVEATIEDEQGKIDLNTAPPRVIGVILGATILRTDIKSDNLDIPVVDTSPFYTDHNPKTVDGLLRLDGEYIAYRDLGTIKLEDGTESPALKGCIRGLYLSNLLGDTYGDHLAGALIIDARGFKVAFHPVWNVRNQYHPYESLAQVREIANWSLLELRVEILRGIGVTDDFLKGAGIDDKSLRMAGLAMEHFKVDIAPLTEREQMILDKLRAATIDVEKMKSMGNRRLKQFLESLAKLSDEDLKKYLENQKWKDKKNKQIEARVKLYQTFQDRLKERLPLALKVMGDLIANIHQTGFNVEALGAVEMEKIKRYFTIHSSRPQLWSDFKNITKDIEPSPFRWWSAAWIPYTPELGAFGAIEIRAGSLVEYRKAWSVWGHSSRGTRIVTIPGFDNAYTAPGAVVRGVIRPRINVNTAPKMVLKALFTGLRLAGSKDYVSLREADYAANLIIQARKQGGIQGFEQLAQILLSTTSDQGATNPVYDMDQGYSLRDAQSVLANALSPSSSWVGGGTYGFTFSTGNVYTIKSRGIINGEDGSPIATSGFKQIVQVAPPRPLQWIKDSQFDFTSDIKVLGKEFSFSGRTLRNLDTFPVSPYLVPTPEAPWVFPDTTLGKGEFRLKRVRMPRSREYTENFDDGPNWVQEGNLFQNQAHNVATAVQTGGLGGLPSYLVSLGGAALPRFPILAPAMVEFWVKPVQALGTGIHSLFDTGEGEKLSRVQFGYDGNRRRLFLSVADDSISSRVTTIEAPINFRPNRWYHICGYWKGSNPWDLALFVDGQQVGKARYTARLASAVDQEAFQITVDSTLEFPPYGVIQIGREVCSYVARQGNRFILASRQVPTGQKDKQGNPIYKTVRAYRLYNSGHSAGTLVTLFGYANPILQDMVVGKCLLNTELRTPTPSLMLAKKNPAKKTVPLLPTETILRINPAEYDINKGRPIPLPGGKPLAITYKVTDFPQEGYIEIGGYVPSIPTNPLSPPINGREIVYYRGIQGGAFTNLSRGEEGTTPQHFLSFTTINLRSFKVSSPAEYPATGKVQLYRDGTNSEWILYAKAQKRPEFFLITSRDYGDNQAYLYKQMIHRPSELIMPIYLTGRSGLMGKGDEVTLYDRSPVPPVLKRARMIINRVIGLEYAFTSHIPRVYRSFVSSFGMILKWPTGLLPLEPQDNMAFAGRGAPIKPGTPPTGEYFSGLYDEIRVQRLGGTQSALNLAGTYGLRFGIPVYLRTSGAIDGSATEIPLSGHGAKNQLDYLLKYLPTLNPTSRQAQRLQRLVTNLQTRFDQRQDNWNSYVYWYLRPDTRFLGYIGREDYLSSPQRIAEIQKIRQGGLIKIDQEILYVGAVDFRSNILTGAVRGLVGSRVNSYGGEEPLFILEWPLAGKITELDWVRATVALSPLSMVPIPTSGYVLFTRTGREESIMAYKSLRMRRRRQQTIFQLSRCRDYQGNPILNNCFGTANFGFGTGDIGVFIPWRYQDRFEPQKESDDLAFYQASFRPEQAYFQRIFWEGTSTPGTRIRIQVRIDGKPDWTSPPNTPIGGSVLYEFFDPKKAELEKGGDEIEVRVYLHYKKGAYRAGLWKETPSFNKVGIEYLKGSRVLYHEALPR